MYPNSSRRRCHAPARVWQVDPAAGRGREAVIPALDTTSGLVGNETRTGNAFAKDGSGTYWFGLDNGLTRYDPRSDDRSVVALKASIEWNHRSATS